MAITEVTGAKIYYLSGTDLHTDIGTPATGDLAIYTYATAGGFIGQEYSFDVVEGWFERKSIAKDSEGLSALSVMLKQSITDSLQVSKIANSSVHINSATITDVIASAAILDKIIINDSSGISGSIKIYDDTTGGTTTLVASLANYKTYPIEIEYNIDMSNGIQVITDQADDITIVYR